jgi:hypothetical protein
MQSLMRHRVDVWRPDKGQGTAQQIDGYARVYRSVPCFVQPASAALQYFYNQRGTTITHTVYTTATAKSFQREDILEDAAGRQYHLTADPLNALESGLYLQLAAEEYPEGAKKRLDRQEYS